MAKIYQLIICHTCQKKIKKEDIYTEWERSIYCEKCFDLYLKLIEPSTWTEKNEIAKK